MFLIGKSLYRNDVIIVSKRLPSPSNLATPSNTAASRDLQKTRIPGLSGSPQVGKYMTAVDANSIFEAITRIELSQVNNMRELELISQDVGSIKSSVQDIVRRVSAIERNLKQPQETPNLGDISDKIKESISDIKPMLEENSKPIHDAIDDVHEEVANLDSRVSKIQTGMKRFQVKPNMEEVTRAVKDSLQSEIKQLQVKPDMKEVNQLVKNSIDDIETRFKENTKPIQESLDSVKRNMQGRPVTENPQNEDPNNYYCKGEGDILSNLYPIEVIYEGVPHKSAEHALQITRAIHVLGPKT